MARCFYSELGQAMTNTSSRSPLKIGNGEFSKGFDIADLKDAKALLDELS